MDLRYINTFHTIVEAGGFNKAAEKLCYTQSTITFHVSQLEKELGVQLFEKAGRHMVLTKAGQELVPYVENVLQSTKIFLNSICSLSCSIIFTPHINLYPWLFSFFLDFDLTPNVML